LPGVSPDRSLPFASSLTLSGREVAEQLPYRGAPPMLEDIYENPVATGPAIARNLGKGGGSAAIEADGDAESRPSGGKGRGKGKAEMREAQRRAKVEEAKKQSFREWLEKMDESRYLLQYHDQIAENFDSLEQVVDIYFKNGEIQKAFFDDAGIKKLGHRRIFEKWFSDTFGTGSSS